MKRQILGIINIVMVYASYTTFTTTIQLYKRVAHLPIDLKSHRTTRESICAWNKVETASNATCIPLLLSLFGVLLNLYYTVNSRFHKKTTRRGSHSLRGDIIRCKCWAGPPVYYFLLIFKSLFIRRGVLYSSRPRWLFMKKGLLHRYPFCWAVVPKRLYGSSVLA